MKIRIRPVGEIDLASESVDCLVIETQEDGDAGMLAESVDRASGGLLSRLGSDKEFTGKCGQALMLHGVHGVAARRILLAGVGKAGSNPNNYMKAAKSAAKAVAASRATTVSWAPLGDAESVALLARALRDADYRFDKYRKPDEDAPPSREIQIYVSDVPATGHVLEQALAIANGTAVARDLGNMPPNECTPVFLGNYAQELGHELGLEVEVMGPVEIEAAGLNAFLAVARGSTQEPRLIAIRYNGAEADKAPVALVGKGVTFDSGGISIKPGEAMDEMKYDMCGAAAVLGVLRAAAELRLPLNLVGVVVACENMPSGGALRPGDIVRSLSGKTIEVLNTDAEGRLILCDALTWTQRRYGPRLTIDIATLTGACVVALGNVHSGLYTNDDAVGDALMAAGRKANDSTWRMPLDDEYKEQLKSNIADLTNLGGRGGGSVTAACFLQQFVQGAWAHLDIAGTAWKSGAERGSTGRPVPLLTQFLIDHVASTQGAESQS